MRNVMIIVVDIFIFQFGKDLFEQLGRNLGGMNYYYIMRRSVEWKYMRYDMFQ